MSLALAVAVPAAVWAALQQIQAPRGWMAAAAAASAAAPLLTTGIRRARNQTVERNILLSKHLRLWSRKNGAPIVGDLTNPVVLGVKPATAEPDILAPWVPPYVPREADRRLDEMLAFSRFVLLVGDSAAGKSRTAFEAMRRRFIDRAVIIPARPDSLATLLDAGMEFRGSVVWLDDLDSYLGTESFTLTDLERMVGSGRHEVTVIATIRKAAYDRFDQDAAISERNLLRAAAQLPLHRQLSHAEQLQAESVASSDPRLEAVMNRLAASSLSHAYGFAEYLAAAPELIRRFDHADDVDGRPVGAALVRAAVDWRRVGLTRSVPTEALFALCPLYLPPDDASQIDEGAFRAALTWATQKVVASSALLTKDEEGYRVFDYLLDYVETEARFLLPPKLLERLRQLVTSEEARRVALALSEIYRQTGQDAALAAGRDIGIRAGEARDPERTEENAGGIATSSGPYPVYDPVAAMLNARGLLLPPDIANFTGRQDIVEVAFDRLASGRVATLTLSGLGGVGKSATAIHVAHLLGERRAFEPIGVYVRLRDQDGIGVAPEDVIADVVSAFGAPGHELRTALLERLVELYHRALDGRRIVFVLDDAVSKQQVLPLLPPPPNVAVVTTRFDLRLDDADRLVLDSMTSEESLAMLRTIVGSERVDADPEGVQDIMRIIGDLPLAIRIIGARLREDPNSSPGKIAAELRDYHTSLDKLSSRGMTVRATFDMSYRKLAAEQARAFRLLGLAPRHGFTLRQASALLGVTPADARTLLVALTAVSLLREISADLYEMHELLRVFALELTNEVDAEADRFEAKRRLESVR
ncbi:MAG TPA: NB-ARC domain-containing protein [Streptosporangiaceae bacterium]|nr:NB-ARC domain-containing protein [Streptosporangiaceae bacterium]